MPAINEALIRDVVQEVLGRLGGPAPAAKPAPAPAPPQTPAAPVTAPACACPKSAAPSPAARRGTFGVFEDADEACEAAQEAFLQLSEKGVAGRAKVIELIKNLCYANAKEWARIELEETKIGRLDHKVEKLLGQRADGQTMPGWR